MIRTIGELVARLGRRRPVLIGTFVYCGRCRRIVAARSATWDPVMTAYCCDGCALTDRAAAGGPEEAA